jgi:hypothetical protein
LFGFPTEQSSAIVVNSLIAKLALAGSWIPLRRKVVRQRWGQVFLDEAYFYGFYDLVCIGDRVVLEARSYWVNGSVE